MDGWPLTARLSRPACISDGMAQQSQLQGPRAAPLKLRDDPVRTLTVSKPGTTKTTVWTLGQAAPTETSATVTEMAPYSTSQAASSSTTDGGDSLSQETIGAILGSIVGFVILVLIVWYCLSQAKVRRSQGRHWRGGYGSTTSDSDRSSDSERVRRDEWRRRAARGMPQRPPPTYGGFNLATPPTRIPPHVRHNYNATRHPQIRGVTRYP